MHDYSINNIALTILLPDGITSLTTTSWEIMAEFNRGFPRSYIDSTIEEFLSSFAQKISNNKRVRTHVSKVYSH